MRWETAMFRGRGVMLGKIWGRGGLLDTQVRL